MENWFGSVWINPNSHNFQLSLKSNFEFNSQFDLKWAGEGSCPIAAISVPDIYLRTTWCKYAATHKTQIHKYTVYKYTIYKYTIYKYTDIYNHTHDTKRQDQLLAPQSIEGLHPIQLICPTLQGVSNMNMMDMMDRGVSCWLQIFFI